VWRRSKLETICCHPDSVSDLLDMSSVEAECCKPFSRNPDSVSDLLDMSSVEAECLKMIQL
jgi:hypothetical protein